MAKFQTPAQLASWRELQDKSLSLIFHTGREASSEDIEVVRAARGGEGWLLFAENEFSEKDIPAGDAESEGKTPSQRLRGRMYVYWKEMNIDEDFEKFYRQQMENIGQKYLDRIPKI